MSEVPRPERLIHWIEDHWESTKFNLSSSGFSEPDLESIGVDTSFENMKKNSESPADYFKDELCKLYGFPRDNVFLTTGGSESIGLLSLVAKLRKLPVFIGLPEYEPIFNVPHNFGIETHTAAFDRIESLMEEKPGQKAFFFSNPNNPMGSLHNREFLQSIRERQFAKSGFMYADEAFLEFAFQRNPVSFYEDSDEIMINGSMTKFYGFSNFRVGWIVGPENTVSTLRDLRNVTGIRNPEYPLWIAAQFLSNRDRFIERARRIMEPNLALLRKFVSEHEQLSWTEPKQAAFALIKYSYNLSSEEFCKGAFDKEKVLIGPGDFFGSPGSFRLCFTDEPDRFAESLNALGSYLNGIH